MREATPEVVALAAARRQEIPARKGSSARMAKRLGAAAWKKRNLLVVIEKASPIFPFVSRMEVIKSD
jgi:hypothetical protein